MGNHEGRSYGGLRGVPFDGLRGNGGRIDRKGRGGREGGFVEAGFRRLLRNSAYCHSECGAGPATRLVLEAGILDSSLRFTAFGMTEVWVFW